MPYAVREVGWREMRKKKERAEAVLHVAVPRERQQRSPIAPAVAIAGAFFVVFAGGAAQAGESGVTTCATFCAPVSAGRLDDMRAQGLDGTADANIRLSVILWDETRRQTQPAGESVAGMSVSLPGSMPVSLSTSGTFAAH